MHLLSESASTEVLHNSLRNNEPDEEDIAGMVFFFFFLAIQWSSICFNVTHD